MIRYLKQAEKEKSRPLWEKVFSEDSRAFVDFYYSEKARKNKILVAEEDGEIIAMLHRNPYDVIVRDRIWKIDYVAGVATLPEWRHKGYMSRLLSQMFLDLYAERMEFCYLVPASPDIYLPFDFTYIFDMPSRHLKENGRLRLGSRACSESLGGCAEAARFAQRQLGLNYEVYTRRDEDYYRSLCREVRSADGDLILLKTLDERQKLSGILAYYGEDGNEQREMICLPEFLKENGPPEPAVMARIIHLESFVRVIRLEEDSPVSEMELMIEVSDHQIGANNGIFKWKLNKEGSSLSAVRGGSFIRPHLSLSIAEMTAWLFGYRMPRVPEDRRAVTEQIRTLKGVYFDEIV